MGDPPSDAQGTQKATLILVEMYSGTRIGGVLSSPGYELEFLVWAVSQLLGALG